VDIVLGTVLHVTTIVLGDILRRKGIVVNISVYSMILVALICEDFQESGAT
jgi:hypothetical protein